MERLKLAVGLAVALAGGCGHQTGSITQASGVLAVEPPLLDFGDVGVFGTAARMLRLRNLGQGAAQLVSLTFSGPDASEFTADAPAGVTLASGEAVDVEVDLSPGRRGALQAEVDIVSGDPQRQVISVPLTGVAVAAAAAFSPMALDFGKVEQGTTGTRELTAENAGAVGTRAVLVPAGPDAAALRVSPDAADLAPGASRTIAVSWTPARPKALDAWLIALPCPYCQVVRIDLSGTAIPYELIAVPPTLTFGPVPKDLSAQGGVQLENVSDQPVEVDGVALGAGSSGDFSVGVAAALPVTLPPGGSLPVTVRFLSTSLQAAAGAVAVASSDPGRPTFTVPLAGRVGGALIAVAPVAIDFGVVPLGAQPDVQLVIENQGSGGPLNVTAATVAGAPQFTLDTSRLPASLAPEQAISLPVYFQPAAVPEVHATIDVRSDDPLYPVVSVALSGSARTTLPCALQLVPQRVDFGTVAPGTGAVLVFHAIDVGPDVCVFRHIEIDPASDPGFLLPGGDVNSFVIAPGEFAQAQVAFRPVGPGLARGAVAFSINDPAAPGVKLPLAGNEQQPCLSASPPWLDFGPVVPGCGAGLDLSTRVINLCPQAASVSRIFLGDGTTKDFSLSSAPATPLSVPPGGSFVATVHYDPTEQGMQGVPLFIGEDDLASPMLVPVLGELLPPGLTQDDFVQQSPVREDVLFVMANTGSMQTKLSAVLAAVPAFAGLLTDSPLDWHVGVTTTGLSPGPDALWGCPGGAQGGEDGRLFPVDGSLPRVLDRATGDLTDALEEHLQVGFCHYYQQGLQAMALALTPPLATSAKAPGTPQPADGNGGFLRDDASLAVVVVSDDDDYSGLPIATYVQVLRELSGWGRQRRVSLSAVVDQSGCPQDTRVGTRYLATARATAGATEDLCATDLGPAFAALGRQATTLQRVFPLSQLPQPGTINVTVDGATASGWSYDPGANAVDFQPGAEPPAGSHVAVSYVAKCR